MPYSEAFTALLLTRFDGEPTGDIYDVIYAGFDDPAHRDRVTGLEALMNDPAAPELERFLACVALTLWCEPAGYEAIIHAAADPKRTPWYDFSIDRKFSVDSTFSQLADAVSSSHYLVEEKGTAALRTEAFRALVRIADSEYFEDKLDVLFEEATVQAVLADIEDVVARGVRSLAAGEKYLFDLPTQLIDLAGAVSLVDEALAVRMAMNVLDVSCFPRALRHATTIVFRAEGPEARRFGEHLMAVGDDEIRKLVLEAREHDGR